MNRIIRRLVALLVVGLLLGACASGEEADDGTLAATDVTATDDVATIEIADFAFSGDFDLVPGETVQVVNNDGVPHTFTADDGSFDTGTIDPGDSVTFTVPGTEGSIDVFCSIHPSMTARLEIGA